MTALLKKTLLFTLPTTLCTGSPQALTIHSSTVMALQAEVTLLTRILSSTICTAPGALKERVGDGDGRARACDG